LGYIVVTIDGRGSNERGLKFESGLKNSFLSVELDDQVQGINYLLKNKKIKELSSNEIIPINIDQNKIATFGHSYGG
jgi:dipeptidyl aminopeptidase/acylaminoacyl peptidase